MKVKMKLDLASIKSWLLNHGEKVAFGLILLVFVLFTYSALQRESLEATKAPERLQELASTVQNHVTNSKWDANRQKIQVIDYQLRAQSKPVDNTAYKQAFPLNPPIAEDKAKRDAPTILGPEELQVRAGFGVFAFRGANASPTTPAAGDPKASEGELKPQAWVVVTGVVPVQKQEQEYQRVFERAAGGSGQDVPVYAVPILERVEVDASNKELGAWQPVPDPRPFEEKWQGKSEEIASQKYIDPNLTGNLGPLHNGSWDVAVTHPKVPLSGEEAQAAPAAAPAATDEKAAPEASRYRFNEQPGAKAPAADAAPATSKPANEVVAYRLLRAFDYTVEPNKRYRYRVILDLKNPNFGLSPQYLAKPELAKAEGLSSAPSEPTAAVTVPDGQGVLAGTVEAGTKTLEPTVTLMLTTIDKAGTEAGTELAKVSRGSVANARDRKVTVPGSQGAKELTLDFAPNMLVLDIYGGKPLSRKNASLKAPGEVLLLDANGNMIVRHELDDRQQYERFAVRDEEPESKKKSSALKEDEEGAPKKKPPRSASKKAAAKE